MQDVDAPTPLLTYLAQQENKLVWMWIVWTICRPLCSRQKVVKALMLLQTTQLSLQKLNYSPHSSHTESVLGPHVPLHLSANTQLQRRLFYLHFGKHSRFSHRVRPVAQQRAETRPRNSLVLRTTSKAAILPPHST